MTREQSVRALEALVVGHRECGNPDPAATWYVGNRLVCEKCAPLGEAVR